jgi:hypothetical protein
VFPSWQHPFKVTVSYSAGREEISTPTFTLGHASSQTLYRPHSGSAPLSGDPPVEEPPPVPVEPTVPTDETPPDAAGAPPDARRPPVPVPPMLAPASMAVAPPLPLPPPSESLHALASASERHHATIRN